MPDQQFKLGQNTYVLDHAKYDLESPHCGVLSAYLGGDCEDETWYRVRDGHGSEADVPADDLMPDEESDHA